jgi:acyl-coenzyme A thioesterase PaaI-like protein
MANKSKFEDVPWCAALLNAPDTLTFEPASREEGSASQDQLFARTLRSNETVPRCIGFYQDPTEIPESAKSGSPFLLSSASLIFELRPGVNGFNGTVHGGLIGALMDESMGSFLYLSDKVYRRKRAEGLLSSDSPGFDKLGFFTGRVDIRLLKPIPTPQIVVVTSHLAKVDGRKVHIRAVIKGQHGQEFAVCDGTWVSFTLGKL